MMHPSDASTRSAPPRPWRRFAALAVGTSVLTVALAAPTATHAEPAEPELGPEPIVLDCSDRGEIVSHLEEHYGETFTGSARQGEIGLMELYARESGTWTILLTLPDGQSCPLAAGVNRPPDLGGGFI